MNKFILTLLLGTSSAFAQTTYHIKWTTKLPVDVKVARGPQIMGLRLSEKGIYKKGIDLRIIDPMPDGKVTLRPEEKAYLYALIKNTGKKTLKFSVAPHSTKPGNSALGFNFNCLCNGHVYEVGPGEIWYKVMMLDTNKLSKAKEVVLVHDIFDASKNGPKMQVHHHPGHNHH